MAVLVGAIIGFAIGGFAFSNILLPIFWAWPKARRLARAGRLKRPIPVMGFVLAPLVWTTLLLGSIALAAFVSESLAFGVLVGLGLILPKIARLVINPNQHMEADFAATYGTYLDHDSSPRDGELVPTISRQQDPTRAPRLLFVDNEDTLRSVMAGRLAERGFEVVEAESGEQAVELLEQFAFDAVITDLRMPGVDGTHIIEVARQRYPGIVIIVITSYGTVKDAVDAIKRGATDFIAKPFQFDELMHVLQKALEQQRTL